MFCNILGDVYANFLYWTAVVPDVISNMEDSLKSHVTYCDEYSCLGPGCAQLFSVFADG